jgi:hypothetical protein
MLASEAEATAISSSLARVAMGVNGENIFTCRLAIAELVGQPESGGATERDRKRVMVYHSSRLQLPFAGWQSATLFQSSFGIP